MDLLCRRVHHSSNAMRGSLGPCPPLPAVAGHHRPPQVDDHFGRIRSKLLAAASGTGCMNLNISQRSGPVPTALDWKFLNILATALHSVPVLYCTHSRSNASPPSDWTEKPKDKLLLLQYIVLDYWRLGVVKGKAALKMNHAWRRACLVHHDILWYYSVCSYHQSQRGSIRCWIELTASTFNK